MALTLHPRASCSPRAGGRARETTGTSSDPGLTKTRSAVQTLAPVYADIARAVRGMHEAPMSAAAEPERGPILNSNNLRICAYAGVLLGSGETRLRTGELELCDRGVGGGSIQCPIMVTRIPAVF